MRKEYLKVWTLGLLISVLAVGAFGQAESSRSDASREKAEAVLKKAVQSLGGDRYLNVKTQIGKGKFSVMKAGTVVSFQSFLDVIVFPDHERTEFKSGGAKHIQVNTGSTGWVYDADQELVKVQTERQVESFKQSIRTSVDTLLRSHWKGEADISYVGKRPASLGKRNDVVRLTYNDGFWVEFEFAADDALPQKAVYLKTESDGEELREEDRYAQYVDVKGIRFPYVVDRFTNGAHSSRINYESVEFNRSIPDSIFDKPSTPKEARRDIKLRG